jgi:preprotein translocase subunit SecF
MKLKVIKYQYVWWAISGLAILLSLIAMAISFATFGSPLRPGLDFVGGTKLQLALDCSIKENCQEPLNAGEVRDVLAAKGLANSTIQVLEDYTLSVRTKTLNVEERTQLQNALTEKIGNFDPKTIQIDTVGPTVGQELFASGLLALVVSFAGIIAYISARFQFDYALFAIFALFHDTLITAGVFAVLGIVAQVEVDSLFLVSLLTIIGFSTNDTVVIYDRIRENIAEHRDRSINEIVDDSVNQTLTRSLNTNFCALLPLIAIFLFGGETLKYFALALIVGFILGTYSSIFVASTMLAWWKERYKDKEVAIAEFQASEEA